MVRVKNRYIVFHVMYPILSSDDLVEKCAETRRNSMGLVLQPSPATLTAKIIVNTIRHSLQLNFGDFGSGVAGGVLQVKFFSERTSLGIIKVSRESLRLVCAAIMLINKLQGNPASVRVLRVSGSVEKAEKMLVQRGKAISLVLQKNSLDSSLEGLFDRSELSQIHDDSDQE